MVTNDGCRRGAHQRDTCNMVKALIMDLYHQAGASKVRETSGGCASNVDHPSSCGLGQLVGHAMPVEAMRSLTRTTFTDNRKQQAHGCTFPIMEIDYLTNQVNLNHHVLLQPVIPMHNQHEHAQGELAPGGGHPQADQTWMRPQRARPQQRIRR